ncbi:MAG: hypothetical protein PWP10_3761, partial [Clostridiales bacterium]|nr:hypothetical protein [Clostridiales bacterium]
KFYLIRGFFGTLFSVFDIKKEPPQNFHFETAPFCFGAFNRNRTRPHLTMAACRDWIAFAMRRCWSGSSVLMYIRTLRSSTFPRLAWLDSTVSYRPLRVRLRIHGKVRSDQLGTNYSSTYKKLPRGEPLYVGAFNRNRTDDLILTMDALYRLSYKGGLVLWSG